MRFYISDLHFYHRALNTAMDCRGFVSVEEMNAFMIAQWNSRVRRNDEVVILGDLSLGKGEETNAVLDQLKGKLYLIEGNHDRMYLHDKNFNLGRFEWVRDYAELHDNGRK
ncbi:MAG: metallophosphoesterase, partial [Lachnospiraceae bacterium]